VAWPPAHEVRLTTVHVDVVDLPLNGVLYHKFVALAGRRAGEIEKSALIVTDESRRVLVEGALPEERVEPSDNRRQILPVNRELLMRVDAQILVGLEQEVPQHRRLFDHHHDDALVGLLDHGHVGISRRRRRCTSGSAREDEPECENDQTCWFHCLAPPEACARREIPT